MHKRLESSLEKLRVGKNIGRSSLEEAGVGKSIGRSSLGGVRMRKSPRLSSRAGLKVGKSLGRSSFFPLVGAVKAKSMVLLNFGPSQIGDP